MSADSTLYLVPPHRPDTFTRKPDAELDCLGYDADGPSPYKFVLEKLVGLAPGQLLRLRIGYEPILLDLILDRRGFSLRSERDATGRWTVDLLRLPS